MAEYEFSRLAEADVQEIAASIKSFPPCKHVVFYLPAEQGIEVARVLHQRMEPGLQFDELK